MTLRERLMVRYGNLKDECEALDVPATGYITKETAAAIQALAISAHEGDVEARDRLFFSLQPRLRRVGSSLRPWPNTPAMTGIWDRQDVQQESWIVFVELLTAWDESVSFVPYLFSRFAWRLRDRILRGIGKSMQQFGSIRVPASLAAELLVASDAEQPESVAMARTLLEELLRQHMRGNKTSGEVESWLDLIGSSQESALMSPGRVHEAKLPGKKSRVA